MKKPSIIFLITILFGAVFCIDIEGFSVTEDGVLINKVDSDIEAASVYSKPRSLTNDLKAVDICASGYKTVILTEDGKIYEWGMGSGASGKREVPFQDEEGSNVKIIAISCGDYHNLALSEKGEIYSWGKEKITLGQSDMKTKQVNDENEENNIPKKVGGALSSKKTSLISAGYMHNIVISGSKAYGWGDSKYGQTGSNTLITPLPKVIQVEDARIKSACTGGHHSLLLTHDGDVLAFGSGSFGKLGNNDFKDTEIPTKVNFGEGVKIKQISCGGDHSLAISEENQVYTWGWNEFGQLGTNDTNDKSEPTIIQFPDDVTISSVAGSRYGHSMAISSDGNVYTWGWNELGQLGTGDLKPRLVPDKIGLEKIKKISGGFKHTVALDEEGNIFGFGDSVYGQLGEFE